MVILTISGESGSMRPHKGSMALRVMLVVSMPQMGMSALLAYCLSFMSVTDRVSSPEPRDWLKGKETDLIVAFVVLAHM